jgi:hypothetical protein
MPNLELRYCHWWCREFACFLLTPSNLDCGYTYITVLIFDKITILWCMNVYRYNVINSDHQFTIIIIQRPGQALLWVSSQVRSLCQGKEHSSWRLSRRDIQWRWNVVAVHLHTSNNIIIIVLTCTIMYAVMMLQAGALWVHTVAVLCRSNCVLILISIVLYYHFHHDP